MLHERAIAYLKVHRGRGAVAAVEHRVEIEVPRGAARLLHSVQLVQVRHREHLRVGGVGAIRRVVEGDGGLFELIRPKVGFCAFDWTDGQERGGGSARTFQRGGARDNLTPKNHKHMLSPILYFRV